MNVCFNALQEFIDTGGTMNLPPHIDGERAAGSQRTSVAASMELAIFRGDDDPDSKHLNCGKS